MWSILAAPTSTMLSCSIMSSARFGPLESLVQTSDECSSYKTYGHQIGKRQVIVATCRSIAKTTLSSTFGSYYCGTILLSSKVVGFGLLSARDAVEGLIAEAVRGNSSEKQSMDPGFTPCLMPYFPPSLPQRHTTIVWVATRSSRSH
jgi:hypothetical protein